MSSDKSPIRKWKNDAKTQTMPMPPALSEDSRQSVTSDWVIPSSSWSKRLRIGHFPVAATGQRQIVS
jgi:hypothetical protein